MHGDRTSSGFFEEKYVTAADPWNFAGSPYELGRYEAVLRQLGTRRFAHAVEPGCSVGVLTRRLAEVCGTVDAFDCSPTAVQQARARCTGCAGVRVRVARLEEVEPCRSDLLVFSEVGYYFTRPALRGLLARHVERLEEGGWLVGCHWLGHSGDHLLHGDEVHAVMDEAEGLEHVSGERAEMFRVDVWSKRRRGW